MPVNAATTMENKIVTSASRVILYQNLGFIAIMAMAWFVELTGLRALVLGDHPYLTDFRESTLEMLVVLGVWLLVTASSRRLLEHVRKLEGFLRLCAWCRRVNYKGRWISLEQFFRQGFNTPTTHGICPDCLARQKAASPATQSAAASANAPAELVTREAAGQ